MQEDRTTIALTYGNLEANLASCIIGHGIFRYAYPTVRDCMMHALTVITGNSEADNATAAALWANHQPSLHPAEPPPT